MLIIIFLLVGTFSIYNINKVSASNISMKDFVNLLINAGLIAPEKIPLAKDYLSTLDTPTNCIDIKKDLKFGSEDSIGDKSVNNLQSFLVSQSLLDTVPTGYFGNKTLLSVKKFQTNNGISNIGLVGPITREKIKQLTCNIIPVITQPTKETYIDTKVITKDEDSSVKKVYTMSVVYHGNDNTGGSIPIDSNKYKEGDIVSVLDNVNSLEKNGHSFYGWNTTPDGLGTDLSPYSTFVAGLNNITLYAKYIQGSLFGHSRNYRINYDGNNNTTGTVPVDSRNYKNGQTAVILDNTGSLTKIGNVFAGWNTSPDGFGTDYATSSTIDINRSDITLYSKWNCTTDISTGFSTGTGIVSDPYQICNWTQLSNVRNNLSSYYTLTADISSQTNDYSGLGDSWIPIGDSTNQFTGSFNGADHIIKDLTISTTTLVYTGLFGYIGTGGITENLSLVDLDVYSLGAADVYVGGLAGYSLGTTSYITASGEVYGATSASGGYARVGGVIGKAVGTISTSSSSVELMVLTGNVGRLHIGGLAGEIGHAATFTLGTVNGSYATGDIGGSSSGSRIYPGGLVGFSNGNISDSYAKGNLDSTVTSNGNNVCYSGGLVGTQNEGNIYRSYATGNVSINGGGNSLTGGAGSRSGGLAGGLNTSSRNAGIYSSFATGDVTSSSYDNTSSGGLVGMIWTGSAGNTGIVSDSFATGDTYSYSTLTVLNKTISSGGLVGGFNLGYKSVLRSYAIENSTSSNTFANDVEVGLLVGASTNSSLGSEIKDSFAFGTAVGFGSTTATTSYGALSVVNEGGIIGWLGFPLENVLNNYWFSTGDHPDGCISYIQSGATTTDANCSQLSVDPTYFYNSTNAPLDVWSTSDWYFSGEGLPVPKWANDAGIIGWEDGKPYVI